LAKQHCRELMLTAEAPAMSITAVGIYGTLKHWFLNLVHQLIENVGYSIYGVSFAW